MALVDSFLVWWLKSGRYPWSRFIRRMSGWRNTNSFLPTAKSLEEVTSLLRQVTWTMDSPFHLYDSISLPGTVWDKKRDDCDGFAVLAATLLKRWKPSTNPKLVTVMLHPVRESHTVCAFREGEHLRFFDNYYLNKGNYQSYEEIVGQVQKRGERIVCWDAVDPESLRTLEFHRITQTHPPQQG